MKRLRIFNLVSLMFLGLFFCLSCTSEEQNLLSSMENFVNDVEKNKADFTEKDWEYTDQQMLQFLEQYKELRPNLTDDQRTRINQLIGKYAGFRVKNAVNDFTNALKDFGDQFKGFLNEVIDTTSK